MAWTTPRTWVYLETVTVAMMNEQVRDNETYLKSRTDISDYNISLDTVTTAVAVSGVTSEQTLYTFSVPGGTLSTANMLRLRIWGTQIDGNTTGNVYRIKYGGTTMLTITTTTVFLTAATFRIDVVLNANAATNAQRMLALVEGFTIVGTPTLGTAAEDSTAAKSLAVTVQPSDIANACTLYNAALEYLAAI